jgi:hypothetical protein
MTTLIVGAITNECPVCYYQEVSNALNTVPIFQTNREFLSEDTDER